MKNDRLEDETSSHGDGSKLKTRDAKLSIPEKFCIILGTVFVVILMVFYRHPEIYSTPPDDVNALNVLPRLTDGWAEVNQTLNYASLNRDKSAGAYKTDYSGLTLSSIGVGSVKGSDGEDEDHSITAVVYDSIMKGLNVIDTSINSRGMRSEKSIGKALKSLFDSGKVGRQSLFISTKAGFIPADSSKSISPTRTVAEWSTTLAPFEEFPVMEIVDGKHCIAPACLKSSLSASRANLGISTIDVFYLDNAAEMQMPSIGRTAFMERLKAAFIFLETQRAEKTIKFYGMATTTCFTAMPDSLHYLSLNEVAVLAESVGGVNHGFRYIQLPYTVAAPKSYFKKASSSDILMHTAMNKINVMSSIGVGTYAQRTQAMAISTFLSCIRDSNFADVLSAKMDAISSAHASKKKKKKRPQLSAASKAVLIARSIPGILSAMVEINTIQNVHEYATALSLPAIPLYIVESCMTVMITGSTPPLTDEQVSQASLLTSALHTNVRVKSHTKKKRRGVKGGH